jgi:predicted aspartyl protease
MTRPPASAKLVLLFASLGSARLTVAAESIRLPVTLVQSNPVTTITVGDRQAQAIVDTGGGMLVLSRELIDAAGGVKLVDTQAWNDTSGNEHRAVLFRIPFIDIGGRELRDTGVIQAAPSRAGDDSRVPNIIGRRFLSEYFVVVDYAGGVITLWTPGVGNADRAECGDTRIPMEPTKDDEPHLAVGSFETPTGRLRLAWDTGATYSMLPSAMAGKFRPATITRGDTEFYSSKMLTATGQDFGPLEFVLLPLQLPKDFQGMLGANFFAKHVVCFDYERREVRIR